MKKEFEYLKKKVREMADVRGEPVEHMILELIAYCETFISLKRMETNRENKYDP